MAFNQSSIQETIYSWEGWLFNVFCAVYFLLISPHVLEASVATMGDTREFIPWLGFTLIMISLLEIYAFPKKMKYVHRAVMEQGDEIKSGFFLWMFHAVISMIITFTILESFGYNVVAEEGKQDQPWWMMPLIFGVVIKELVLLFTIIGLHESTDKLEAYKRPNKTEWIVDLILLVYACLVYTVTWENIASTVPMEKHNTPMYIVNLVAASLLFLIFYLPIRIPYYLEEMAQIYTLKDAAKFIFGILVVLISVVVAL